MTIRGGEILFLSPRPIFSDIMKILIAYLALVVLAIYLDNNPIYLPFNFWLNFHICHPPFVTTSSPCPSAPKLSAKITRRTLASSWVRHIKSRVYLSWADTSKSWSVAVAASISASGSPCCCHHLTDISRPISWSISPYPVHVCAG